jgi:hypothetical protein
LHVNPYFGGNVRVVTEDTYDIGDAFRDLFVYSFLIILGLGGSYLLFQVISSYMRSLSLKKAQDKKDQARF